MPLKLTTAEARIIACLIEKSIVTPNQYPLTLNSLRSACNQKSSRNPVMAMTPGEVQSTVRQLEAQNLVQSDENFKSRTSKYRQRFCNSRYSDLQFEPAELAIICLLLLRGPQTPGELRANSGRLHTFADNHAVTKSLEGLMAHEPDALVLKLPRTPGRKESEYTHLFFGPVDVDAYAKTAAAQPARIAAVDRTANLEARVEHLEKALREIREKLGHDRALMPINPVAAGAGPSGYNRATCDGFRHGFRACSV